MGKAIKSAASASFTKEQILESCKYMDKKDLLTALLLDSSSYSFEEIDEKIEGFMKGRVN